MSLFTPNQSDYDAQRIVRVAGIFSIIGLVALYTISTMHTAPLVSASEVTMKDVGDFVRVHGTVKDAALQDGTLFITVGSNDLQVVSFQYTGAVPRLNTSLMAVGEVQRYEGNLEVIARTVDLNASVTE